MTHDVAGPSVASGGSQPVAWAVVYPNGEEAIIAFRKADAEDMASASDRVVPLYRSPALTWAEREAITDALAYWERPDGGDLTHDDAIVATVLRRLLERLG